MNRTEFCALTGLDVPTLRSRAQRYQLPFVVDQEKHGRGYHPFEAFLTILSEGLAREPALPLNWTAGVVAKLADVIAPQWSAIIEAAEKAFDRDETHPVPHILCGVLWIQGAADLRSFCGTMAEIATAEFSSRINKMLLTSATGAAFTLMRRAHDKHVEMPLAFWSGDLVHRRLQRASLADRMRASQTPGEAED